MENEVAKQTISLIDCLPYIATILCSIITGFASYLAARKQSKADMLRLTKQYELDLEKEREKFEMEKEKLEIEHRHQLELKQKDMENKLGSDVVSLFMTEYIKSPAGQAQLSSRNAKKRK